MDTVSQAVWGALSSQALKPKKQLKIPTWCIGLVGGVMPDLDVFLKSTTDPLFSIIIHRHFTHSIFFIPIGALILWLFFFYFFRKEKESYFDYYIVCILGYGTHWVLDVMTSYGTLIFWPFTDQRYALDWLSIVDPILTLPWIVALLFIIFMKNKILIARAMILFSTFYFLFCGYQNYRATQAVLNLAQKRGHSVEKVRALPSLANSVWFRTIYKYQDQIFADGILVKPFGSVYWKQGEAKKHITLKDFEGFQSETIRQIKIWNWFTDGWMYWESQTDNEIGDGRYSKSTEGFDALWILKLDIQNPLKTIKTRPSINSISKERDVLQGYKFLLNTTDLEILD